MQSSLSEKRLALVSHNILPDTVSTLIFEFRQEIEDMYGLTL
jgi:hypothetical protein